MCESYAGKLKQDGGATELNTRENLNGSALKEEQKEAVLAEKEKSSPCALKWLINQLFLTAKESDQDQCRLALKGHLSDKEHCQLTGIWPLRGQAKFL